MSENSTLSKQLKQLNPLLSKAGGVYQNNRTQVLDSKLSSYIQGAVKHSYESVSDLTLFSTELEALLLTDELREALSPSPLNFLLSFNFDGIGNTLDLSQDFGGVSHYLASRVSHVDSVKIDIAKAKLSAKRCSEFDNITFISETLSNLVLEDNSYELIIVSQLEELELDKSQQVDLINKLQLALSNTGRLVVNAANQQPLNKWSSPGKQSPAFSHLYEDQTALLFNEKELSTAFKKAGFLYWDKYSSFSQDKSINNLFSKDYLNEHPHSINHFNRLGSLGNQEINEYLAIKNIHKQGNKLSGLASRFIIIASASKTRSESLCNIEFVHFSGTSRKPQWRTTTLRQQGSNQVEKIPLHPNYPFEINENTTLSQSTAPQEFKVGKLLLDDWLNALIQEASLKRLNTLINEYSTWLSKLEKNGELDGRAYDVLPFNIIVEQTDSERVFNIIDPEWQIKTKLKRDFILFRALFWFAFENKNLLEPLATNAGLPTIGLFVLHYLTSNNIDDKSSSSNKISDLSLFVELEESIQKQIGLGFRKRSIEYALQQTFTGDTSKEPVQPACQISWGNDAGSFDEHNSVFIEWSSSSEKQILNNALPTYDQDKTVLRIDPIATMGMFKFTSIKLNDRDGNTLWELSSASEIWDKASCLNLQYSADTEHFTALNDDPHFLIELTDLDQRNRAHNIELVFALVHNQYYDASLKALSTALSEQNTALFRQIASLDSKQAEIEYLSAKLKNVDNHRQALQRGAYETQQNNEQHTHQLNLALQAQILRVKELENNVLIRYYFRAKRLSKRIIKRLIGRV